MKKLRILAVISILLMLLSNTAYAEKISLNCNIITQDSESLAFDFHGVPLKLNPAFKLQDIWWTGREYILHDSYYGGFKKSTDLANWETVSLNQEWWQNGNDYANMLEPAITYYNGIYVVRDLLYEDVGEIISKLEWGEEPRAGSLIILNDNMEFVTIVKFDYPITDFSYVEGDFYLRTQDYKTNFKGSYQPINTIYVSEDAINWKVDETLSEVPLHNGLRNILTFDNGTYNGVGARLPINYTMTEVAISKEIPNKTPIKFEQQPKITYEVADELYLTYEKYGQIDVQETSFKVSLDGVYWYEVDFPEFERYEHIELYLQLGDKIVFQTSNRLLEYSIEELKQAILEKNGLYTPYVQVNNEILGFDTPPVLEADRTLVPMRFLFEKLGAEVTWDDTTNTATATLPANATEQIQTFGMAQSKSVSFSIDNTTATVNGAAKEMDVPARLINDRTMVPLRFLSENLGYTVTWDEATKTAIIE